MSTLRINGVLIALNGVPVTLNGADASGAGSGGLAYAAFDPRAGLLLNIPARAGRTLNRPRPPGRLVNDHPRKGDLLHPVRRGEIMEIA